jgi:HSP20 family protein
MAITKYDPFTGFPFLTRQFEDALSRFLNEPSDSRPWTPAVDVYETEHELVLKADLPDVKLEDIDIRLEEGTLQFKGERKFEKEDKAKGYHRIERGYGSFTRAFTVPDSVDVEHIQAGYKDGVLTITMPKKEVAKPRSIKVNVGGNGQ